MPKLDRLEGPGYAGPTCWASPEWLGRWYWTLLQRQLQRNSAQADHYARLIIATAPELVKAARELGGDSTNPTHQALEWLTLADPVVKEFAVTRNSEKHRDTNHRARQVLADAWNCDPSEVDSVMIEMGYNEKGERFG